jgi:hypothetical protein
MGRGHDRQRVVNVSSTTKTIMSLAAVGYTMNRMAPGVIGSDRAASYLTAVYDALR